jgi:hypothetical protein
VVVTGAFEVVVVTPGAFVVAIEPPYKFSMNN